MGAARSTAQGRLGATVLEVMSSLMAPVRAEKLLLRALAVLGWRSVPEDAASVKELVEGPLLEMIADEIGIDVAVFVLDDLAPILELAASGVRRTTSEQRTRARASTLPAPSMKPEQTLRIAVATLGSLEELKRHVGPFADVRRVRDAFELFSLVDAQRGPLLVVIDGHRPAVELSALAMLLPQIPQGCRVILWGFEDPAHRRFLSMDRWSTIGAGDGWRELADALRDFG